ncbi:hypothetical protein B2G71_04885 [Novosphingobium sp. PC22D]|nr:hypothetical protein B2G71_04885 [Novosphingobium sp. PC22D]
MTKTAKTKTSVKQFLGPEPMTGSEGTRGTHWLRREEGDRIWLVLDRQGVSTNTFNEEVFSELDALLDDVEKGHWRTVIFRSAKASGFAAGADLSQFRGVDAGPQLDRRIAEANDVIDRVAALKARTVAVVHGTCVGGGLELALACDRIVARDDTRLGFPEVLVGLHPGLGGTARLTHRIQPIEAMTLMLTGKTVSARKAFKLGIVDAVVPERNVAKAVDEAARGRIERRGAGFGADALNLRPARLAAGRRMRAEADKRAPHEHYPAPYALIELWERHGGSQAEMLEAERRSFAALLPLTATQNLVRAFFLRERLKTNGKGKNEVAHVHVIGAGTMGAEIGAWCALKGMHVTIEDPMTASLSKAVAGAHKLFARKLDGPERLRANDRFVPDVHGAGLRHADLVIEAAPEKTDLKRGIYERIEGAVGEEVIIATNTSSLDLNALSKGLKHPERFVGIHFFNPVSKLDLVEVVRHDGVAEDAFARALRFVGAIGKLPLPVKAAPGFLVNRALMPYLGEALLMIEEGEQPERIDAAAERFGMPVGPVELADQVGLDICLAVAESLAEGLDRPMPEIPEGLRIKVDRGELGRKTGTGLYAWDENGKALKNPVREEPDAAMADRLILPMIDAVAAALDEGVVEDDESADAAMVYGTGFAPFRGGPIEYARSRGFADVASTLEKQARLHGPHHAPSAWWRKT